MHDKILIIDFGSQYTQLIARRIREMNVYSEIHPCTHLPEWDPSVKGVIFSGSPFSVHDADAPQTDPEIYASRVPFLGICYGAQLLAKKSGSEVVRSKIREYGRAFIRTYEKEGIFAGVSDTSQVWMSHGDSIHEVPEGYTLLADTESIPVAGFRHTSRPIYGIQFHPEVTHSEEGNQILKNFVVSICKCVQDFTPRSYIEETVEVLKEQIGEDIVIMGLSGGVDSTVAAVLLHKAIGKQLHCIFVDNGLLRKNEYQEVLKCYEGLGLQIKGVDASNLFYESLKGLSEPEAKRKAIGRTFIEVFETESKKIEGARWLGQGTIYPDVIESVSVKGPSATIKSHHNVGGLPERMQLKVVEPIRMLFKDGVRMVGKELGIPNEILGRHPFPGPGLGIRILGEITPEKVCILQEVDAIYIQALKKHHLYDKIWQAGSILLPIFSVGVMGDERTYEQVVALRAVTSVDGMTADWYPMPYSVLAEISNDIINRVKGVNRVVYDVSSKPPSTIEWE